MPSTLCGARARGDRARDVCDKMASATLPRGVVRAGSSNPWTPACYERHSCFLTLPLVHEPSPSTLSCLACMLFVFGCMFGSLSCLKVNLCRSLRSFALCHAPFSQKWFPSGHSPIKPRFAVLQRLLSARSDSRRHLHTN